MALNLTGYKKKIYTVFTALSGFRNVSTERIMLLTVPLIFVISIVGTIFLPNKIADYMVMLDANRRAELWQRRTENLFNDMIRENHAKRLQERLSEIVNISDIYRLKVFDADGNIIWSTREDEVGQINTNKYFFDVVAAGRIYSNLEYKNRDEIDNVGLYTTVNSARHTVAEIYRPFVKAGRFQGAIEFYSDVSGLHAMLASIIQKLVAAIAGIGSLISMLGVFFLLRSNRNRMSRMRVRSDRDAAALAEQARLSREVNLLGNLNEWMQSATTLSELFDMVSQFMGNLLPNSAGTIYVYSNSRDVLDGWSSWNGGDLHDHIRADSCWGLRRGRTYAFNEDTISFPCAHVDKNNSRPYYCFPILAHGETVGLMHVESGKGEVQESFRTTRRLAQMCAEQISMAIANVRMRDMLREQSIRDSLTGLFNRRHMNEILRRYVKQSSNGGETVAVLSIDVDHFKLFNDNHGHDAGDIVLRSVGKILSESVSGNEVACRPGGEEFSVILIGVDIATAALRAEEIRASIEALKVAYDEKVLPTITVSIGLALAPIHAQTVQDLLKVADEALYEAKDKGRNVIVKAKDPVSNVRAFEIEVGAELVKSKI